MRIFAFLRGVLVTLYFFSIHTLMCSVWVVFSVGVGRSRAVIDYIIQRVWSRWPLFLSGVTVEVRGFENIPQAGDGRKPGGVVVFNHQSYADIFALYGYFPDSIRFGAKVELFKIPVFGAAMRLAGVLPIDRSNRDKVLKIYEAAIPRLQQGEYLALAPEGTRQNEKKLGKFKTGPFIFAIQSKMPMYPVVIEGAMDVMPKSSVLFNPNHWRQKIVMQILPPVYTTNMEDKDVATMQNQVFDQMNSCYQKLIQEASRSN